MGTSTIMILMVIGSIGLGIGIRSLVTRPGWAWRGTMVSVGIALLGYFAWLAIQSGTYADESGGTGSFSLRELVIACAGLLCVSIPFGSAFIGNGKAND